MAAIHSTGHLQPTLDYEEHTRIGGIDGKKTFVFDNVGNQITSFGGLATVEIGSTINANVSLSASDRYIGLVTNTPVGLHTLAPSPNYIGLVSVAQPLSANVSLGASEQFIGMVSVASIHGKVSLVGNTTLADAKTYIGLTTTTLGAGTTFVGLVTAVTRNAGTNKTLIPKTLAFATSSIVTIAVPTNTFYITKLILNSNATIRLNIKSGATYLTGNASLGINLNPGGGWVENGSPDAPVYNGLAAAAAIVLEKFDSSGVVSQIGGHLLYFDE